MIIMFSDGKQVLFLKEMLPFLGQSIKILLEGHIWRELWLGLQYLVVYLAVPVSTCPAW